jgi:hypothetical protein
MSLLRLPTLIRSAFVSFCCSYHAPSFWFVSPCYRRKEAVTWPGCFGIAAANRAPYCSHGKVRVSQVSGVSFLCLCTALRPRSCCAGQTIATIQCCPRCSEYEDHNYHQITRLNHRASAFAVYASTLRFPSTGKTRFRLMVSLYRMGFAPIGLLMQISRSF